MNRDDRTSRERRALEKRKGNQPMNRFILAAGCALLFLAQPVPAKPKPKPPAISVCYGYLCLTNIRWRESDSTTTLDAIEGVFENRSNVTVSNITLEFELISGRVLFG